MTSKKKSSKSSKLNTSDYSDDYPRRDSDFSRSSQGYREDEYLGHRRSSRMDEYESSRRNRSYDQDDNYDDAIDYVGIGVGHTGEQDPSNFSGRLPPLREKETGKGKKKKKGFLKKHAKPKDYDDDDLL